MSITLDGTSGITSPGLVNSGNETVSGTLTASGFNAASTFGFKNRIINGAMNVWQRGTSFTNISSGGTITYGPDRWTGLRTGWAANLDFSRQTGFGGFPYCLRMQRTSGTTSTALLQASQFIESNNCSDLAGQTVTFSCWIRAGANYSGGSVGIAVYTGSGTDQGSLSCFSGTWTTFNSTSTSVSITTTATLYTFTTTIPAGTNEIAINLFYTPTGTAGAADYIEFTGVQLEKGSTATSFDYRPYGTELQLCQRYYHKSCSMSVVPADGAEAVTFTALGYSAGYGYMQAVPFPVRMRTAPTITSYRGTSGTNGVFNIYYGGAWYSLDSMAVQGNDMFLSYQLVKSGSLAALSAYMLYGLYTASAEL